MTAWLRARLSDRTTVWGVPAVLLGALLVLVLCRATGVHLHLYHALAPALATLGTFLTSDAAGSRALSAVLEFSPRLFARLRTPIPAGTSPATQETTMSTTFAASLKAKIEAAAEQVVKTEVANLPAPYNAVGVAVEAIVTGGSTTANWIAFGEALFAAIEAAEAKVPAGYVPAPVEPALESAQAA